MTWSTTGARKADEEKEEADTRPRAAVERAKEKAKATSDKGLSSQCHSSGMTV